MTAMISFPFQDFYVQYLVVWGIGLGISGGLIVALLWARKDH